ncbi:MAG: LamG domain-containing protein, partial [Balneolaceae bacterium]
MVKWYVYTLLLVLGAPIFGSDAGVNGVIANPNGMMDGVTPGLVARYDFDGSWRDVSGNGNHARPQEVWRGRDAFTFERRGSALFQSTSSQLRIPVNITPGRMPEMTFTGWIKRHGQPTRPIPRMSIFSNLDNRAGRALRILEDADTRQTSLTLFLGNEETDALPVDMDNWVFVAVTFSESGQIAAIHAGDEKITVDGSAAAGFTTGRIDLTLGHCPWDQRISFQGLMDDVRIYNRVLSNDEIRLIRDARTPAFDQFGHDYTAFIPKRPETVVRNHWTHDSPIIGSVEPSDILYANRVLRAVNTDQGATEIPPNRTLVNTLRRSTVGHWVTGRYYPYESIEVDMDDGQTGYVALSDLMVVDLSHPAAITFLRQHLNLYTRSSQILTLTALLLILLFMVFYPVIDSRLLRLGYSYNSPGVAWPVLLFLTMGFILGVMYPFTAPQIYNFLETPLLWPAGHEFAVWYLSIMMVL